MTSKIGIYNHLTQEQIVREMNPEEQAERDAYAEAWLAARQNKVLEQANKQQQKNDLLIRLGITEEEASLLAQSL